jgi:glycosidase
MFGQAFDGNDVLSGAYTFPGVDEQGAFPRLDSVFYFSQYYAAIKGVFMQGGPTTAIECIYNQRMGLSSPACGDTTGPTYYDQPHAMPSQGGIGLSPQQTLVNFLDNHDIARFIFAYEEVGGDPAHSLDALYNAIFFQMTWDGIPCMYYGTEQAFEGGVDPANREDMFVPARQVAHRHAQEHAGAPPRRRADQVVDDVAPRRHRLRNLRVRAHQPGRSRPGRDQHRRRPGQHDLRPFRRGRGVHDDLVRPGHHAHRRRPMGQRRHVHRRK